MTTNNQTHLFHADVFMPPRLARPVFEGRLRYGNHARAEAMCDRYGIIELPQLFEASDAKLIETEFDVYENVAIKQVWRQRLDNERDIVLVITRDGFVKTVWVNLRSDKHLTLDTSRYVRR